MLIDSHHLSIRMLVTEWEGARSAQEDDRCELSRVFKNRLADKILEAIVPFGGELVLMCHEFLARVPSGAHSFAHGSEMISETVYWTHAARISRPPKIIREHLSRSETGCGRMKIRFAPSTAYLIPVVWQQALHPFYPNGANQPSFGFTEPSSRLGWMRMSEPEAISTKNSAPLNINCIGDHLFRLRGGLHDWTTKTCLAVGTEEVEKWLIEHRSQEIFDQLVNY